MQSHRGVQIPSTSKLQDTVHGFYCTAIYTQVTDEAFSIRWRFVKEPIVKGLSGGDPRSTKQNLTTLKPRLIFGILHVSLLLVFQGVKLMLCKDCLTSEYSNAMIIIKGIHWLARDSTDCVQQCLHEKIIKPTWHTVLFWATELR